MDHMETPPLSPKAEKLIADAAAIEAEPTWKLRIKKSEELIEDANLRSLAIQGSVFVREIAPHLHRMQTTITTVQGI